jgi:hypothetical protein
MKSKKSPQKKEQIEKTADADFPEPYYGAESYKYFFNSAEVKTVYGIEDIETNSAENGLRIDYNALKPEELMRHYLRYVMANLDDSGMYRRTDKQVQNDMLLSTEDRAQRIKKRAIELGFLVPQLERKQVLSPQTRKINKFLGGFRNE